MGVGSYGTSLRSGLPGTDPNPTTTSLELVHICLCSPPLISPPSEELRAWLKLKLPLNPNQLSNSNLDRVRKPLTPSPKCLLITTNGEIIDHTKPVGMYLLLFTPWQTKSQLHINFANHSQSSCGLSVPTWE
jgi:hypothetical protein